LYLESGITINAIAQGKDVTQAIHKKLLSIGYWNMDTTASFSVAHGLGSKVIGVTGFVYNDALTYSYPLGRHYNTYHAYIANWGSTYIELGNYSGSYQQGSDYDATDINRGYLIVFYVD
jgi:hypothetical protein